MLLAYFEGKLTPEEAHRVEQWLATDTPEGEALEGLEMLPAADVRMLQSRINGRVAASSRRNRAERRKQPMQQRWLALTIILLLALVFMVCAWLVFFRKAG